MIGNATYLDLVLLRNTLRNRNNETDLVLNSLKNGVRGGRGRNVENGSIGLGLAHGLRYGKNQNKLLVLVATVRTSLTEPKMGRPRWVCPAFLGETPPTMRVPNSSASSTWKVP